MLHLWHMLHVFSSCALQPSAESAVAAVAHPVLKRRDKHSMVVDPEGVFEKLVQQRRSHSFTLTDSVTHSVRNRLHLDINC